ncbi:hypothetical protein B0T22DRAFT_443840 [Podospora appendiculata]|uniref:Chromosome transmission fidelity protein 4 n=1 Tax=Podospora appendiculata TaxID=314037 RepID=A0AAE0X342_9PEZI|nr:hypothetical protein B0T22DRAFT_443840 [Podospora appendiculata]
MSAPTRIFRTYTHGGAARCLRQQRLLSTGPSPSSTSSSRASPSVSASASSPSSSPSLHNATTITATTATSSNLPEVWFSANFPLSSPSLPNTDPKKPPDDRKAELGKTLRILQERLPTLLQSPLPQEVLSPNITLHLFPSTHPHLPTVTGRVAYVAALWTSPIAWNRVPIVGNVKLEILSERMVSGHSALQSVPRPAAAFGEQLVVRWRTVGDKGKNWGIPFINNNHNGKGDGGGGDKASEYTAPVGMAQAVGARKEFTGLFIFDFDKEGRILSHTIEHAQEGGQWERGVGAKVVGLTDWLLGGMKGGGEDPNGPCPAFAPKEKC